jgi:tetratricopeptide (TPR) repeat protein
MPHSFSQTASLTCPQCGRAFSAEVWLIVDADERPDMAERIRAGTLHDVTCPHCGHQGQVDAPLLLLRPGATPPLLFSPAQGTTPEEDRQQAAGLVGLLQERSGPAWRDEWLAQGLPGVPRPLLPAAMSDDPEAYRQLEEAARELVERLLAADPFMAGLQALLEADSMTALLQAARDHPILLTAEAETRLHQGIENARHVGQEEMAHALEERYRVLRQTVQAAQESGLTLEQAIEMTAQVEKAVRSGDVDRRLALAQTLQDFIQAETWDESRRILEAHPELLTDEADALLGQLVQAAQAQGDEDARHILEEHRALLRRCREVGIERAFAELGGPPIPPEFQADLRRAQEGVARYGQTGDPAALNQAIAAWERILNHPAFPRADERFRLAAWNDAGGVYLRRYWRWGEAGDLDRALGLWMRAVQLTPADSPDLPSILNNLGTGLSARYARSGELEDLRRAIESYERAVQLTPADSPDLPSRLNNLGNGLRARYARSGELEDLRRAIESYERAVQLTPADSPDLPSILNNLGTGLHDRYARSGELEDLQRAIESYERAVQLTPADSPDLPGFLNNLGNGLRARYARSGELEDLRRAIESYERAVQLTPADSPDLPGFLNNLGNGLRDRYARSGELEDLRRAIESYERAVQLTPADSPDLPSILNNLGTGLHDRYARSGELEDLRRAIESYERAVQLTPADSPDLPGFLNNLGNGLRARYARSGELEDLRRAIESYERAVQLTPADSPDLPSRPQQPGQRPARPLCAQRGTGRPAAGDRKLRAGGATDPGRFARPARIPQQPGQRPARPLCAQRGTGRPAASDRKLRAGGATDPGRFARPARISPQQPGQRPARPLCAQRGTGRPAAGDRKLRAGGATDPGRFARPALYSSTTWATACAPAMRAAGNWKTCSGRSKVTSGRCN